MTSVIASPPKAVFAAPYPKRPDEEHVLGRDAVDLVAVHGAEERVEEQREDEDEDRRLAAAPEHLLLEAQLMDERRHSVVLGLFAYELEVDVLERRPPNLELLELVSRRRAPPS